MTGNRSVKKKNPEAAETVFLEERVYRITCRNKVSETIGGVKFVDGVGYTKDGFSASWFENKGGYTVNACPEG